MLEIHQHKGSVIILTDQGPMGHEEGAYVACEFGGDWKFFHSQGPLLVNGFENAPKARTKLQALEAARELIERDLRDLETSWREFQERKQDDEKKGVEEGAALYVPQNMQSVPLPLQLFLDLHNALPASHHLRRSATDAISDIGNRNSKAHWTRGVRKLVNGDLAFNEASYWRAVWRGKQETRTESAIERFNKLHDEIEFVVEFAASEDASVATTLDAPGTALVELPEYSSSLEQMRLQLGPLNALAKRMSNGIETMLSTPPSSQGLLPEDKP